METPNQPNGQYLPKHSHFDPFKRVEHAQTYQVVLVLPTNQPTNQPKKPATCVHSSDYILGDRTRFLLNDNIVRTKTYYYY